MCGIDQQLLNQLVFSAQDFHFYAPYRWHIWQLAPLLGKGVSVAIIDNGIAVSKEYGFYKNDLGVCWLDGCANVLDYPATWRSITYFNLCVQKYCGIALNETDSVRIMLEYVRTGASSLLQGFVKKENILQKLYTIISYFIKQGYISPVCVYCPLSGKVIVHIAEFLPFNRGCTRASSHGSSVASLLHTLAPQSHLYMVKGCNDEGHSNLMNIVNSLCQVHDISADIVNLSILVEKLEPNNIWYQDLKKYLSVYPFVYGAAGNNSINQCAEQSCLVGAYDIHKRTVAPFCQHLSADIYAPGVDVEHKGVKLHGTSFATAITTGSMALLWAEAKSLFLPAQIRKLVAKTGGCINGDFYTFDLKTALFVVQLVTTVYRLLPFFVSSLAYKENQYEVVDCLVDIVWKDTLLWNEQYQDISFFYGYSLLIFSFAYKAVLYMKAKQQ